MTPNQNQDQKNWFHFIGFVLSRNSWEETVYDLNTFKTVEDPGEKPGSFAPPSLLERGEKKIFETAPCPIRKFESTIANFDWKCLFTEKR